MVPNRLFPADSGQRKGYASTLINKLLIMSALSALYIYSHHELSSPKNSSSTIPTMSQSTNLKALFRPVQLGPLTLKNRVGLSPMTRSRSVPTNVPNDINVEYYRQRAAGGAGIIITEGTLITAQGCARFVSLLTEEESHRSSARNGPMRRVSGPTSKLRAGRRSLALSTLKVERSLLR